MNRKAKKWLKNGKEGDQRQNRDRIIMEKTKDVRR